MENDMAIGDKWLGNPPTHCDLCRARIQRTFVDGRTGDGRWGIMCPSCRVAYGPAKLGIGLGQKYERQGDSYVRTA